MIFQLSVETLYICKHTFPVRFLHFDHIFNIKQWCNVCVFSGKKQEKMKHLLKAELAALKACISTWKETKVFLHVHAIFNRQCSSSVKNPRKCLFGRPATHLFNQVNSKEPDCLPWHVTSQLVILSGADKITSWEE